MSDYHELENEWKKYRFKKMLPRYLWFTVICSVTAVVVFLLFNKASSEHSPKPKPVFKNVIKPPEHNLSKEDTRVVKTPEKPTPLTLSPNFTALQQPLPQQKSRPSNQKHTQLPKKVQPPVVNIQSNKENINAMIQRFEASKNPDLALMIAKRFYKEKDYDNAYNYALLSNELDSDNEESWLLFAKCLYKLHKTDTAIKVLQSYIRKSDSLKAKVLLDKITSKSPL